MKKEDYSNVKSILEGTDMLSVHPTTKGLGLRFPIYLSKAMMEEDITALELSVRASNCLKRSGIHTIGDLCERIHSSSDLKAFRNCGNTSVAEIMDKLFLYNYMQIKPEKRGAYLAKIVEMNVTSID